MSMLYYVDDQTDYKPTLSHIMSIAAADTTPPSLEMYTDVESFMKKIESDPPDNRLDKFLLDINMPAPRRLKKLQAIWPQSHPGEEQFCGIALAKWLQGKGYGQRQNQVALITHWETLQHEHEAAIQELHIVNITYHKKSEAIDLRNWIKEPVR